MEKVIHAARHHPIVMAWTEGIASAQTEYWSIMTYNFVDSVNFFTSYIVEWGIPLVLILSNIFWYWTWSVFKEGGTDLSSWLYYYNRNL